MGTIVITRHKAYVEYLKECGLIDDQSTIIEHVEDESILHGSDVITSGLPYDLAALCRKVTVVPLRVPPQLRGQELTLQQVKEFSLPAKSYRVLPSQVTLYTVVVYQADGPGYDTRHVALQTLSVVEANAFLEKQTNCSFHTWKLEETIL